MYPFKANALNTEILYKQSSATQTNAVANLDKFPRKVNPQVISERLPVDLTLCTS